MSRTAPCITRGIAFLEGSFAEAKMWQNEAAELSPERQDVKKYQIRLSHRMS